MTVTADTCPACGADHQTVDEFWACPRHGHQLQLDGFRDDSTRLYACPAQGCTYQRLTPPKLRSTSERDHMSALATREKSDQLVTALHGWQDDIAMAAASHIKPATIIRVAQGALRKDPKLMAAAVANPLSLLHCLLDAARLGHEPGTDQYWLIPFGDEVTGIEGYKGIIERMFRAGAVSAVVAETVRQRDVYHRTGAATAPVHDFDEFADPEDRGPLRGAYAYAVMLDGRCSKIIAMGRAEIMKHKAMSRGSGRPDSPWQMWEESMWKKTPLRTLETYVPTSSEWLKARAQAVQGGEPAVFHRIEHGPSQPSYAGLNGAQDGEIVEDAPAPQPEKPLPRRRPTKRELTLPQQIAAEFDRLGIEEEHERITIVGQLGNLPEDHDPASVPSEVLGPVLADLKQCAVIGDVYERTAQRAQEGAPGE